MPMYVLMGKFTEAGSKDLKEWVQGARSRTSNLPQGFKSHGFYVTQGQYDTVHIVEAPNNDAVMAYCAQVVASGHIRPETMPAVTFEHFAELVK
jgi:uncharacterized protein with GYD domain